MKILLKVWPAVVLDIVLYISNSLLIYMFSIQSNVLNNPFVDYLPVIYLGYLTAIETRSLKYTIFVSMFFHIVWRPALTMSVTGLLDWIGLTNIEAYSYFFTGILYVSVITLPVGIGAGLLGGLLARKKENWN